jgi:membrane protease YdiL (CAAX protease family)
MARIFTDSSTLDPAPEPQQQADLRRKLTAIVVAIGLTVVSAVVVAVFGLGLLVTDAPIWIGTAIGELGFAIVAAVYLQRWSSGVPIRVPSLRGGSLIVLATVGLFVLNRGVLLLLHTAGYDFTYLLVRTFSAQPVLLLVMAVVSILIVGPAEELLFRGAIQGRLGRAFGPIGAIGITSLLFTPLHTEPGAAVAIAAILGVVFISSVVFGYLYERTGNLTSSILAHGFYNATVFVASYLAAI